MNTYSNAQQHQQEDEKDSGIPAVIYAVILFSLIAFLSGCSFSSKLEEHADTCFMQGGTPEYTVNGSSRRFSCRMAAK